MSTLYTVNGADLHVEKPVNNVKNFAFNASNPG